MAGPKMLTLWALGLPSSPSRRKSENSHAVTDASTFDMSGPMAPPSIETALAETESRPRTYRTGPRGGAIGPRRGAMTKSAWRCCVCGHKNKTGGNKRTGRSSVCCNLDKTRCAARLSVDETEARPVAKKSLNHERCDNCFPAGQGVYAAGHDKLWPLGLDPQAKEELESGKAKDLAEDANVEFDFMVAERKPKGAERDPLTWQRIGAWPREAGTA
ncbi:hypothetical protein Vi05172_g7131 [Venturia inaequalis]|nr:hypothetical protein Vi05172_g7131 [Venturia inaequalis]